MTTEFPYKNLAHYLEQKDLLQATEDVLASAKREYHRLYQCAYRMKYAKTQVNLVLGTSEFDHVTKESEKFQLKPTQYILHLIRRDREGHTLRPNLLIDIEVGLLQSLDALAKRMGSSPKMRGKLIDVYTQIEELVILVGSCS